jgi:uncharacterized membrane protein
MKHSVRNFVRLAVTIVALIYIISGIAHGAFHGETGQPVAVQHAFGRFWLGVVILAVYWCAALINWITDRHQVVFRAASVRIPEPQEIADTLAASWGRPPTVEEVAAVHTMLVQRRNEAAVKSLAIIGAELFIASDGLNKRL